MGEFRVFIVIVVSVLWSGSGAVAAPKKRITSCENTLHSIGPSRWTSLEAVYHDLPTLFRAPTELELGQMIYRMSRWSTTQERRQSDEAIAQVVKYVTNPKIVRTPYALEKYLKERFKQELADNEQMRSSVNITANIERGLTILRAVDRQFRDEARALTSGSKMILNLTPEMAVESMTALRALFGVYQASVLDSVSLDRHAFQVYFQTLSKAPALDAFLKDRESSKGLALVISKIRGESIQHPNPKFVSEIVDRAISYRVAEASDPSRAADAIANFEAARDLAHASSKYYRSIAELKRGVEYAELETTLQKKIDASGTR